MKPGLSNEMWSSLHTIMAGIFASTLEVQLLNHNFTQESETHCSLLAHSF